MKTKLIAALAAMLAVGSAQAVTQTASNGFQYELLDFSGSSSSLLVPTNTAACDIAFSSDFRCDPMKFTGGLGGELVVTALDSSVVYQDLPQGTRGLGVVSGPDSSSKPWISGTEELTLTFANMVNLVGYHVYQRDDAQGSPDQFKVRVDGGNWVYRSFASLVFSTSDQYWLTGKTFSFMAADNEKFYVGAVKITSAIPEPQTYALMLAGLGVVGLAARRRRAKG
jgi:hypothetical protein